MTEKNKSGSLIKGAAILGIAGICVKLMGGIFRIPLTNWIGDDGMSYYGVAYTVYSVLLVLATSGMPVAISRMVAERIVVGEYKNAHRTFQVALSMIGAIGTLAFLICFFFSEEISAMVGNREASLALKAISPALLMVPITSAFRGYFQGRHNMKPTALSEVLEQAVRVCTGLTLAYILTSRGLVKAAAGAAFGATAGAIMSFTLLILIYLLFRPIIFKKIRLGSQHQESYKSIAKKICYIAIPIIIGAEIMPVMSLLDTSIIMNRLQATGWTLAESKSLYGIFSGFVNPIIALPQILTVAVAVSLVPAISSRFRVGDKIGVSENVQTSLRTTLIMAYPCCVGIIILAKPILLMLYPAQQQSAITAVSTLQIMSLGLVFLAIDQTATGILQAVGKQIKPVKNLGIGAIVKGVLTYILVGFPSININGAAIGTMAAYGISLILNMRDVRKYTGAHIDFALTYIKPMISSIIMGVFVFGGFKLFSLLLGSSISTLLAILLGGIVYSISLFVTKAITVDELDSMPVVNKLSPLIKKVIR